jgi:hypothetical protein
MPFTNNFGGCFWRTCQFQRGGIPGVRQFPGVTTISRLSSSIGAQIPDSSKKRVIAAWGVILAVVSPAIGR